MRTNSKGRVLCGVFWLAFCAGMGEARAQPCKRGEFTPPERVHLSGETVLLVTHPSVAFDGRMGSKLGMDAAVKLAKTRKTPVVYLHDDGPDREYFFGDCEPDYWMYSAGGELKIDLKPANVISVGGHWELCQSATLHDVMLLWARQPQRDHRITVYMDGVYMKGSMSFQESDPYYGDFQRFVGIVNYGRGGEAFSNKLTMLEAMGIIVDEQRKTDFLSRSLPHYERTLPDYRVELRLNGAHARVLQKGKGSRPPTLVFEFIDTATEAGWTPPLTP